MDADNSSMLGWCGAESLESSSVQVKLTMKPPTTTQFIKTMFLLMKKKGMLEGLDDGGLVTYEKLL